MIQKIAQTFSRLDGAPLSQSLQQLLEPANPGQDFLAAEDWIAIAGQFGLSQRETCVAILLFEGQSRYAISRRLQCAPGTVRVYIDRLFQKLNVQDRVGLVLRIARIHLAINMPGQKKAMSHKSATCR